MQFMTMGRKGAPAVLLIHGMLCSGDDPLTFGKYLADGYYVISPTLDGHGDDGSELVSAQQEARNITAYLKDEQITSLALIQGSSMGAEVALAVADECRRKGISVGRCFFDGGPFFDFPSVRRYFMRLVFRHLIKAFEAAKDIRGPVLIHVLTQKGRGYEPAEVNPSDYHGVGPFDIETGVKHSNKLSYTGAFSGAMLEVSAKNKNVVGICAAMAIGTGMDAFAYKNPSRFFDCGIAEEHCVTMAGGMASVGMIPVVAIYSSFLQRAYDEILHDVCYMNNHVVFAIDRAGFVGNDGHTHNGIHDISYLNSMPGMTILSPRDYTDLKICMDQAVNKISGPVAIRYPRGASPYEEEGPLYKDPELMYKPHVVSDDGDDYVLITTGLFGKVCENTASILKEKGYKGKVICLTVLKPLNTSDIIDVIGNSRYVFTGEEGILTGGFGESLKLELTRAGYTGRVDNFAIEDQMIRAGSVQQQLKCAGLDAESMASRIEAVITEAVK